jgi:hypothetical protein
VSAFSTTPLANVFSAFSRGLESGEPTSSSAPNGDGDQDTFTLLRLLQALAESPEGRLPFSLFANQLPGDPVATLASTVKLMREGWVEFVGPASEQSDVRLTDRGRAAVSTLTKQAPPAA